MDCFDAKTVGDFHRLADAGAEVVKIDFRHVPNASLEQRLDLMQEFSDSVITRM
ncbi:hypothetical protein D3C84_1230100 [compost metagenome]